MWLMQLKLLDEKTADEVEKIVSSKLPTPSDLNANPLTPNAKSWALFLLVVDALDRGEENNALTVDDLAKWVPPQRGQLPKFVRHCWDGYFLFSRQVARRLYGEDRSQWPILDIPCVALDLKRQITDWLAISPHDLENTKLTLGDTSGFIETRFARNEYQMPVLWAGVKKQGDRKRAFSAINKTVDAVLNFGDMGLANCKKLEFSDPAIATKTKTKYQSFNLPGLLWAMGLDGGMRRQNGALDRIKKAFEAERLSVFRKSEMTQPFIPAAKVMLKVQSAVTPGNNENARFANVSQSDHLQNVHFVTLDTGSCESKWDANEQTHSIKINDFPILRLKDWGDGRFYQSAGGKTMPVVFRVENDRGEVLNWAWGNSEDWGLEDSGETRFTILPHDDSGSAFCNKDDTWSLHVVEAKMLDMSRSGEFEDYFVLYLRIAWLRYFPPNR